MINSLRSIKPFSLLRRNQTRTSFDSEMGFLIWVLVFLAALVFLLVKFATAEGDFTLLWKGKAKREEIEDKVVWITGASRGIGEIFAQQFASLGAKLILSARSEKELERVKSKLVGKHAPHAVEILPLDLTSSEESLHEAVQKADSLFSDGVHYMVHNAASLRHKISALNLSEKALKDTFEVNVFGTIALTRLLAPFMLKRGKGHFIVISSAAGKTPAPGQAVYSASKSAINGYFHSLRSELFKKGIKVTVVCPGPIETSNGTGAGSSAQDTVSGKRVSSERCAELAIAAASHGLKEVWISNQPVLFIMYLVQYMPTIGYWLMDLIGEKRVETAEEKGNVYSWSLLFMRKKKTA